MSPRDQIREKLRIGEIKAVVMRPFIDIAVLSARKEPERRDLPEPFVEKLKIPLLQTLGKMRVIVSESEKLIELMLVGLSQAPERPSKLNVLPASHTLTAGNLYIVIDIKILVRQTALNEIVNSGIREPMRGDEINRLTLVGISAGRKSAQRMKTTHL